MDTNNNKQISLGKVVHLLYCPMTGLGLYGGYRGKRWLKNRIKIFKQFVVPSIHDTLWISFRYEDKNNPLVKELQEYMAKQSFKTVFTFNGLCFWDDKYPDDEARGRLISNLHSSMGGLFDVIGEADTILMTIQPSDDVYADGAMKGIRAVFENHNVEALGFSKGYIIDYKTKEIKEYNPATNPPFFTIKFTRDAFVNPLKHINYTGPYKSHEYIGDKLKYQTISERGFMVGTHGENVSTVFNHPYAGNKIDGYPEGFEWLKEISPLKIRFSLRKRLLKMLPHKVQRKLRYIFGEKFYSKIYEFLRN